MPLFNQPLAPPLLYVDAFTIGTTGGLTANNVYLHEIVVQVPVTATSLRWGMFATATGTTDIGIYNSAGTLLVHSGATTNVVSSNNSVSIASTALTPGVYYLALCPSNGTDTYARIINLFSANPRSPSLLATNTGTAGVLPGTTGGVAGFGTTCSMAIGLSGGI